MSHHPPTPGFDADDLRLLLDVLTLTSHGADLEDVIAVRPWMRVRDAHGFLERALRAGYIDWAGRDRYRMTGLGASLLDSGLRPRFDRETGEALIARVIQKARAWNDDPASFAIITSLRLFGSLLHDRSDYGDVDIAVEAVLRPMSAARMASAREAVPGWVRERSIHDTLPEQDVAFYHARRARSALQRISRHLSITSGRTIDHIGADWREIFAWDAATGERHPDPAYHPRSKPREPALGATHAKGADLVLPDIAPAPPPVPSGHGADPVFKPHMLTSHDITVRASKSWFGTQAPDGTPAETPADPAAVQAKDDRATMATALWVDAIAAWDTPHTTPFEIIADIHARAVAEGVILPCPVDIEITDRHVRLEVGTTDTRCGGDLAYLRTTLQRRGKRWDMELPPRVLDFGPEDASGTSHGDARPSSVAAHVGIARALAPALVDLHAAAKVSGGASLSFSWTPQDDPPPVIPSLAPLCRHVARSALSLAVPRAMLPALAKDLGKVRRGSLWIDLFQDAEVALRGPDRAAPDFELPEMSIEISRLVSTLRDDYRDRTCDADALAGARDGVTQALLERYRAKLDGLGTDWDLEIRKQGSLRLEPSGSDVSDIAAALRGKGVEIT